MKRITAAALGAVFALCTGTALAQVYPNEVSVFGSYDNASQPEDYKLSIFHLRYGRYLTPQAVATVGLSRTHFDSRLADVTVSAVTLGAKYYFGMAAQRAWLPFAEAAVGWARADTGTDDGNDLTWEIGGGVSYFVTERTSFDGSLRWYQTDTDGGDTEGVRMFLGLTTRF